MIEAGSIPVSAQALELLAVQARRNGTQSAFIDIALQWALQASQEIDRLTRERDEALGEIESFAIENDTLRHQVIACGVAASHPDANLSRTGAYAGKWNSAQAESVRKLRAERDALKEALAELVACKALKDAGLRSPEDEDAYFRRKPAAWAAARAALAQIEQVRSEQAKDAEAR